MSQSEMTFIVGYRCPSCQAALEARSSRAQQGWLRCPKCGRASLPPDTVRAPRVDPASVSASDSPGDDILVIPASGGPLGMGPGAEDGTRAYPTGAVRRVLLLLGFLVALSGIFTAFLQGEPANVAMYGLLMMAVFAIGAATASRR